MDKLKQINIDFQVLVVDKEKRITKKEWCGFLEISRVTLNSRLGGNLPKKGKNLERIKTILKIASK